MKTKDGWMLRRHFVIAFATLLLLPTVSHALAPQVSRLPSIASPLQWRRTELTGDETIGVARRVASTHSMATAADVETTDAEVHTNGKDDTIDRSKMLTASQPSSSWEEIGRAMELLGITWSEFLSPLGQGLLPPDNANPSSWDEFWELSLKENKKQRGRYIQNHSNNDVNMIVAEQFTRYLERMGPTYVKFGQALSSRPDIVPRSLAVALSKLQNDMDVRDESLRLATAEGARAVLRREYTAPTSSSQHGNAFRDAEALEQFLATLSEEPVAAASIGVVYSGLLPGTDAGIPGPKVAIKIQRPKIKETVQRDARLLRRAAEIIESIPSVREKNKKHQHTANVNLYQPSEADRLILTNITGAVDEFMTRLEEELDYRREASNLELFGKLYSHRRETNPESSISDLINLPSGKDINVVVPKVYKHLCTDKVLVMEWINGIKLVDLQANPTTDKKNLTEMEKRETEETLDLIKQGIDCTLSQLLETGVLHADPHGGNLLKVAPEQTTSTSEAALSSSYRLGYIDFGIISTIPSTVQDGLICAVCQLIFANNVTAVSELFGELQLLPEEILTDAAESAALADELTLAIGKVLVFPTDEENVISEAEGRPKIPTLRFDKLLDVLTRLVPRFSFQLPPYFLNNARALATLEGMAREVDPNFNILRNLYPYAINRIFSNPTNSPVVEGTLRSLIQTPSTGKIDINKLRKLLKDASNYSGHSRMKVIKDIARSTSGPGLVGRLVTEQTVGRVLSKRWKKKKSRIRRGETRKKRRWLIDTLAECSRL